MIACLYGQTAAAFVEPVIADLRDAAKLRGAELVAVTIEAAVAAPQGWRAAQQVYVLPFDVPLSLPPALPPTPASLVRALFPGATIANSPAAHELCWDKLATAQRFLDRGVPMPTTLITGAPDEAADFIRRHEYAVLKEPRARGGHGDLVLLSDADGAIVGEAHGRRYRIELIATGMGRRLSHGVLTCPPPFFLQRLVADTGRAGQLIPAQLIRAYVVEGQVVFWTERYREHARRPSDLIISAVLGARYRFLLEVSEEARKVALRAAEVLGVRIGAVDLIRTGSEGPFVLEVDTDGYHMMIDRGFKYVPEFRPFFDLDDYIAEVLVASLPEGPLSGRI